MPVKVNLAKLKALQTNVALDSPNMIKWKKRAAREYRSFLHKRFNTFSRGGGNWKNTQRRKAGKTKFILRKTHTLFRSLSPVYRNLPGQYEKLSGNSIIVGISGGRHPEAKTKGGNPMSVGKLAQIHNFGEGRMPKRQIIVRPNGELIAGWKAQIKKAGFNQ